jgi:2-polyprenyl-6-hydroxyphenyl methylase/3-demethylubiquinone-9 3-methyltransferase
MTNRTEVYLASFGDISKLPRQRLLDEIDYVWTELRLDNSIALNLQLDAIEQFYSHPVWILNGIFSALDPDSKNHRIAIAEYIKQLGALFVADYGGGSGVLARCIAEVSTAQIDIVEPYPSKIFVERLNDLNGVHFVPELDQDYDVVIAQDVLEHVDNPLEHVIKLVSATRIGGHLIFANCFYPEIKCHLPRTFYLRHTFSTLMKYAGLELVGHVNGAEHALVFKRICSIKIDCLKVANKKAKMFGVTINHIISIIRKSKLVIKNLL